MIRLVLIILCCVISQPAQSQPIIDYSHFGKIPILHQGRIKPLDSFARVQLQAISGKQSLKGLSATEWIAMTLLDSTTANQLPIFNIPNPNVVGFFELTKHPKHLYSYNQVADAVVKKFMVLSMIFQTPEANRSLAQQQALQIYIKMNNYFDIGRSLSTILPDFYISSQDVAQKLGLKANKGLTYFDIIKHKDTIKQLVTKIVSNKEKDFDALSAGEKQLVVLAYQLKNIDGDKATTLMRIIPPQWNTANEEWLSPWALIQQGQGSPATTAYMKLWKELAYSYRDGDVNAWNTLSAHIANTSYNMASNNIDQNNIALEFNYNAFDGFEKSLYAYITAFLFALLSFLISRKWMYRAAIFSLLSGILVHSASLVTRMIIMSRPPVTTLYESIIFVALVVTIVCLIIELKRHNNIGLFVGSFMGACLMFLGNSYASEGDTLGMLQAVLDTNFWLATHVVTITIGYGCTVVAGTLAHIYIGITLLAPKQKHHLESLEKNMLGITLVALFFATLGTILGGIWADQSWGRFWGWDPKENGAMLIALWLIWLVHGRHIGLLRKRAFASLMVLSNVMVALAWFGVNLLNVGLHSYGFTTNIASNLSIFCTLEILIALLPYVMSARGTREA